LKGIIVRLQSATILVLIFLVFEMLPAQNRQHKTTVWGTFTTSSKLFHHALDPDPLLRNQYVSFDNIFGIGLDHRFPIFDEKIDIGLSIECLSVQSTSHTQTILSSQFSISDGFYSIPVEASAYFLIPIGMKPLNFYMGGGIGIYFGGRTLQINGIKTKIQKHSPGGGIHILTGLEYELTSAFSVRTEIKFRDIQFSSRVKKINLGNNSSLPFLIESMDSRISIDGLALAIGIVLKW
jgi:hypothetical protein